MASKSYFSPEGELDAYPWISKADTAFDRSGNPLFHCKLTFKAGDPKLTSYKALIDEAVDAAYDAHMKTLKANQIKDWRKYYPYELECDASGNENGDITFIYKQNEQIKIKDTGEVKKVRIAIYDANDQLIQDTTDNEGNVTPYRVHGGGRGRVRHSMRPTVMVSNKQVGVRLDFSAYQEIVAGTGSSSQGGFGSATASRQADTTSHDADDAQDY